MCFVHWFNRSLIDLWFGVSLDEMRKYAYALSPCNIYIELCLPKNMALDSLDVHSQLEYHLPGGY